MPIKPDPKRKPKEVGKTPTQATKQTNKHLQQLHAELPPTPQRLTLQSFSIQTSNFLKTSHEISNRALLDIERGLDPMSTSAFNYFHKKNWIR